MRSIDGLGSGKRAIEGAVGERVVLPPLFFDSRWPPGQVAKSQGSGNRNKVLFLSFLNQDFFYLEFADRLNSILRWPDAH